MKVFAVVAIALLAICGASREHGKNNVFRFNIATCKYSERMVSGQKKNFFSLNRTWICRFVPNSF